MVDLSNSEVFFRGFCDIAEDISVGDDTDWVL
jgi:hypothetical protein